MQVSLMGSRNPRTQSIFAASLVHAWEAGSEAQTIQDSSQHSDRTLPATVAICTCAKALPM